MSLNKIKTWAPCLIFLGFLPLASHAVEKSAIELGADQISYHDKQKTSEYLGHVRIKVGQSVFNGNHMTVHHQGANIPSTLKLEGKPSTFAIDHTQTTIRGRANSIVIFPKKLIALLIGDAMILNGIETIKSEKIVYHLGVKP